MTCPHCSRSVQKQCNPFGNPFPAAEGTLNLCGQCGSVCAMENGVLVVVSMEKLKQALADPEFRRLFLSVQLAIRRARHLRG